MCQDEASLMVEASQPISRTFGNRHDDRQADFTGRILALFNPQTVGQGSDAYPPWQPHFTALDKFL